jgi:hypothetical protein
MRKSLEPGKFVPGPGAYNPQIPAFRGNNLCNFYKDSEKLIETGIKPKLKSLGQEIIE